MGVGIGSNCLNAWINNLHISVVFKLSVYESGTDCVTENQALLYPDNNRFGSCFLESLITHIWKLVFIASF